MTKPGMMSYQQMMWFAHRDELAEKAEEKRQEKLERKRTAEFAQQQKEEEKRRASLEWVDYNDWESVDTYDHDAVMRAIGKKKFREYTDNIVQDTRFNNVRFDASDIIEMSEYLNKWETLEWLIEECKPPFTQDDADMLDDRWGHVEIVSRNRGGEQVVWVYRDE